MALRHRTVASSASNSGWKDHQRTLAWDFLHGSQAPCLLVTIVVFSLSSFEFCIEGEFMAVEGAVSDRLSEGLLEDRERSVEVSRSAKAPSERQRPLSESDPIDI